MAKDPRERERSAAALVEAAAQALGTQVEIPVVREQRKQSRPKSAPAGCRAQARADPARSDPPPRARPPRRSRVKSESPPGSRCSSARRSGSRSPWPAARAGLCSRQRGLVRGRRPPAPLIGAVREAPAKPVETAPVVSETIDRLDARRVAIRKRLNGAERARGQAATAASLGAAYGVAEKRIAAEAASLEEKELGRPPGRR